MSDPTQPQPVQQPAPVEPPTWPSAGAPATPPPVVMAPQTSSSAVVALVLSIVTWVICFVPPFSLIPAIIALVYAGKADREIQASGGRVGGAGLVTASKIIAWIAVGVTAALLVLGVVVITVLAIAGAFDPNTMMGDEF